MATTPKKKDLPKTQNIVFYLFSPIVERRSKFGLFKTADVIIKSKPNTLTTIRMKPDFQDVAEGFHLATNVIIRGDGIVKFQDNSKILSCRAFPYEEDIVQSYLHPPTKSVREALLCPLGQKLNVEGKVEQVSQAYEVQLKTVILQDQGEEIYLKLWGDKSLLEVPLKEKISVSHVCVKEYQHKKDLNSTALTTIEVLDQEEEMVEGDVDGVGFGDQDPMIVINGVTYHCSKELIEASFPGNEIPEGKIKCTVRSDTVVSIFREETKTENL